MTIPFFGSSAGVSCQRFETLWFSRACRGRKSELVQVLGFGVWNNACLSLWHPEANVNGVPERIESADVIVRSEGNGFAQQIAAGPPRLRGGATGSGGGTASRRSPYGSLSAAPGCCSSIQAGVYDGPQQW